MIRIVLMLAVISMVGCGNMPTTPTSILESDVKIHRFELDEVTAVNSSQARLSFNYDVTAKVCAIFVFEGKQPDMNKMIGGTQIAPSRKGSEWLLMRRVLGEHLVELRCAHDPGAITGPIEKRYFSMP